jgi:spermidine synthase
MARIEIVEGDGRKALEKELPGTFSILVLDAFSGDSVPVHLLSKEAFQLYFRLLKNGGTLVVNVTNRNLDVGAVVRAAAFELKKKVFAVHSEPDEDQHFEPADWMLVTEGPPEGTAKAPRIRVWTDDYNSMLTILK